jgi:hypothetical protein
VRHLKIALIRPPVEILVWRRSTFADKGEGKESPAMCPVIVCGKTEAFAQGANASRAMTGGMSAI